MELWFSSETKSATSSSRGKATYPNKEKMGSRYGFEQILPRSKSSTSTVQVIKEDKGSTRNPPHRQIPTGRDDGIKDFADLYRFGDIPVRDVYIIYDKTASLISTEISDNLNYIVLQSIITKGHVICLIEILAKGISTVCRTGFKQNRLTFER